MATSSKDRRARRLELTKRADLRCARFKLGLPILLKLTAVESGGICKQWPDRQRENVPRLFYGLFQKKAPPAWLSALFQKGDAWGRCFPRHSLVERGWFSGTRFEDKKLRSTPLRRGRKPVASAQKRSPLRKEIYEISMIVVFPIVFLRCFPWFAHYSDFSRRRAPGVAGSQRQSTRTDACVQCQPGWFTPVSGRSKVWTWRVNPWRLFLFGPVGMATAKKGYKSTSRTSGHTPTEHARFLSREPVCFLLFIS